MARSIHLGRADSLDSRVFENILELFLTIVGAHGGGGESEIDEEPVLASVILPCMGVVYSGPRIMYSCVICLGLGFVENYMY